jgi:hypothetical protein
MNLIDELNSYGLLHENWDGEGGVIINPKAIENTVSFTLFLPSDILPPDSAANAYGSVSPVWNNVNTTKVF